MARGTNFDYLHNMRFHVDALENPEVTDFLRSGGNDTPQAGFSSCTLPTMNVEAVEYREGQFVYTRKYPGHVTYDNVTMMRGVAKKKSGLFEWINRVVVGGGEYRCAIGIRHFHRNNVLPITAGGIGTAENLPVDSPATPAAKTYLLRNAFPARYKFGSDLDATSSDISIMELEVAYESCDYQSTE